MPIEKLPDKIHSSNIIKAIRCRNCGNERLITDQWLKEISRKLLGDSSNICGLDITKYSKRFCCSKCKKKNSIFIEIKKQNEPTIPIKVRTVVFKPPKNIEGYLKQKDKEACTSKLGDTIKTKSQNIPIKQITTKKQPYGESSQDVLKRKKENAEAGLRMASRQRGNEKCYRGTSIMEFEDGAPRAEWGTRDDHKKMRARDWGDMRRRQKG